MTDPNKPIKNFEDLPKEWQNIDFLRNAYRKSVPLTAVFSSASAYGWSHVYKMKTESKMNPYAHTRAEEIAVSFPTLTGTALTIIGVAATIKLRRLLRQAEASEKNRNDSSGPSL